MGPRWPGRCSGDGHEVSCLDEDPEAHARLDVGLESRGRTRAASSRSARRSRSMRSSEAGIERADVFVAATDGDNTNIIIAQIAKRRFNVPKVVARILDPLRADWYEQQGLHTICPTRVAIDMLEAEVRDAAGSAQGREADGVGRGGCT